MIQQYIEAGKVVTTHGVRGEVKMEMWCDGAGFLKKVKTLYGSSRGECPLKVASIRPMGQMGLVRFEGIEDMDSARALVGRVFYFNRDDVTLPKGEWYISDLLGCEVRDAQTGKVYGVVSDISRPAVQDIYTIKAPNGREYLFPAVPTFLKEKNPSEGYLTVSPIAGMFDDDCVSEREE